MPVNAQVRAIATHGCNSRKASRELYYLRPLQVYFSSGAFIRNRKYLGGLPRGESRPPILARAVDAASTCTSFALCFRSVVPSRKIIATTRGILWTALRAAARQTARSVAQDIIRTFVGANRNGCPQRFTSREARRAEVPQRDLSIVVGARAQSPVHRAYATMISERVIRFCSSPLAITTTTTSRASRSRIPTFARSRSRPLQ